MNGSIPPRDCEWGEQTVQAAGGVDMAPADWHTDADQIRRKFGIPRLDVEAFTSEHPNRIVYPDLLIHEQQADRTESNKGTDCLHKGDRDSGKTTLALNESEQLMTENGERVLWRGRRGGSGWLPFKHWAAVYLPSEMDTDAYWMQEDEDFATADGLETIDDVESVARDVVFYDGIYDLLETIGERPAGTFNVIYPDPAFRDCEEITQRTNRGDFAGSLPFTPVWDAGDLPATPITDWWAPFLVARAEDGPFQWMTWICDEAGDLFPEGASNDKGRHLHDLIDMLRGIWATSRKRYLSLFMFVHHEENLHSKLRREFKWRIHMPDDSSNPVASDKGSHPVGFKRDIKMEKDLMSYRDVGEALCYTKGGFADFMWGDISADAEDATRKLSIRNDAPESKPDALRDPVEDDEDIELQYDHSVFGEWQNATAHRLIVKDPGDGWVCVKSGLIGEELESPVSGLAFDGIRDNHPYREVVMTSETDEIVVAKIPNTDPEAGEPGGIAGV